jgi:hypothetical protein
VRKRLTLGFSTIDASSKDAALTRGYAICLAKSTPELGVLRPPTFSKLKNVGYSDRAVRKFRHDQIPNRAQALTSTSTIRAATRGIPQGTAQAAFAAVESGSQHISRSSSNNLNPHLMSRDCNVCTTSTSSLDIGFGHGKATSSLTRPRYVKKSCYI